MEHSGFGWDRARTPETDRPHERGEGLGRRRTPWDCLVRDEDVPRLADYELTTGWEAPEVEHHPDRPAVDMIHLTDDRLKHILDGDKWGGGHRHGTGREGKTEFPADWDGDTVAVYVLDVSRHPDKVVMQPVGRWRADGERDGVTIRSVILADGRIWTAWPLPGGRGVVDNLTQKEQRNA